jgi:3-isopropylmalate dehydrogenase
VVVTDNLFGDILTDLAGAVTGGVGFAGTGNLNPDRTSPSLFEPVHGSAHDAVGTDKVNPSSQILSAVMLLEFLGEAESAARIRKALDDVLSSNPAPLTIGDLVAERV